MPEEARWLLEDVPFTETNVFGEPPIFERAAPVHKMAEFLKPAAGVFGSFGERRFQVHDKPHWLYLAEFKDSPALLAGKPLARGQILVKIGITGSIGKRLKALNLSFPGTSTIAWSIIRKAEFPDRNMAAEHENWFKNLAISDYDAVSLGREYFVMNEESAGRLFNKLSMATGLSLRAKT